MAIDRVKVSIQGAVTGAAAMNWYFTAVTSANLTAINTFLTAFKAYLPTGQTYNIPSAGDTIDETTGHLAGSWTAGSPTQITMTSANPTPGQAGVMIAWLTSATINGHHPRGRGLLVPAAANAFLSASGVAPAFVTAAQAAANTFLTQSSGFIVWHRPRYNRKVDPPVLVAPGQAVPVTGATIPTTSVTLRSRNH